MWCCGSLYIATPEGEPLAGFAEGALGGLSQAAATSANKLAVVVGSFLKGCIHDP